MARRARVEGRDGGVPVAELLAADARPLRLKLLAGRRGLDRRILQSRVQRPGLALAGYSDYLNYGRVQIVGGSEMGYLATLAPRARTAALRRLAACPVSCLVLTRGLQAPPELVRETQARGVPLLATPMDSTAFIKRLSAYLEERLAERVALHAVLLDIFGLGVLVTGESGIGKSECALELIDRGHRLVADDMVEVLRVGEALFGSSPDLTRDHMELRGLGVVNVKDLYGVSSIRQRQRLELVVSLERWEPGREYDRLGLSEEPYETLGLPLPLVRMPVAPGRNIALLVEVAARNQLLKGRGYHAARRFVRRVDALLSGTGAAGARTRRPPARGRT